MQPVSIIQVGMGPLGVRIADHIAGLSGVRTATAVDLDPNLIGTKVNDVRIFGSLDDALDGVSADVVVLTTVSDMERIVPQIAGLVERGIPVVSTCEELSYPWKASPDLARQVDEAARENGVAVLGTGVNPGFLMDTLPSVLSGVCRTVTGVRISRIQNAVYRRIPFQRKIGAGLDLDAFEKKRQNGTLRHVGLTESMHFIAAAVGWEIEKTEDIISPIIAGARIETEAMVIEPGMAAGVEQIGRGWVDEEEKITLLFRAAIGEPEPEDRVEIEGDPSIISRIPGGVNGDVATCSITVNACFLIRDVLPGLKTMLDMPPVTCRAQNIQRLPLKHGR